MACPWDSLSPVSTMFCESPLCAWIKEPANTWSNIPYILIGLGLWWVAQKENHHLKWIGIVAILTGAGSFFFHMSVTYLGGCADYLGMFLGTGLLTAYNMRRWLNCSFTKMYFIFGMTTLFFFLLLHFVHGESRVLYAFGMPCCMIELRLFFRDRKQINYRSYVYMSVLILKGTIFWWLDVTKKFCQPDNHFISGHALWHIFTSVSFIPFYEFYKQFRVLKESPLTSVYQRSVRNTLKH